jgi:hypothetical protein
MLIPLNYASANELIETYIGTAYDTVKTVSGQLGDIAVVADPTVVADLALVAPVTDDLASVGAITGDLTAVIANSADISTVATNVGNVNTVAGNTANINTVTGMSSTITAVANDSTDIGLVADDIANVNTVAGQASDITSVIALSGDMTAVLADSTDIGLVAGNIANVNTVAGQSSDITSVIAMSSDITTVIADSADIGTVAGISANVSTVAGDTTDIGTVANNLAAINAAAAIVALSLSTLTLVLDNNTEVVGVNYNSVAAAYAYALTTVQVGGTLNLTVAASTSISDASTVILDTDRLKVNITGNNKTDSVLKLTAYNGMEVTGSGLTLQSIRVNGTGAGTTLELEKADNAVFNGCYINNDLAGGQVLMRINNSKGVIIKHTSLVGDKNALTCTRSDVFLGREITAGDFTTIESATSDALTAAMFAYGGNIILADVDFAAVTSSATDGLVADNGAIVTALNVSFDGDESVAYTPAANTTGSYGTRINTV